MSTLTLWNRRDPFPEFDTLVRAAFGPLPARSRPAAAFRPAAEIDRDGDDAVIRIELPGLDVDNDVTVEVRDGRLVVQGERRDESNENTNGRTLREVRYGSFSRSFSLPASVTDDAVSASYDAGVLSVRVAAVHAGAQARRIPVTTAAPAIEPAEGDESSDTQSA